MKDQHAFDDLARQKLEEREFAFQEADWLAAQALINGTQRRTGGWLPYLLAGVGLMIAGAVAWWAMDAKQQETKQVVSVTHIEAEAPNAVVAEDAMLLIEEQTSTSASNEDTNEKEATTLSSVASESSMNARPWGTSGVLKTAATTEKPAPPPTRTADPAPVNTSTPAPTTVITANPGDANQAAAVQGDHDPAIKDEAGTGTTTNGDGAATSSSIALPVIAASAAAGADGSMPAVGSNASDSITPNTTDQQTAQDVAFATQPPVVPVVLSDTSSAATTDSADAAAVVPPLLPLPTSASPWEFSVLFGGLLTGTTYTGGNSAEWAAGLKDEWTATGGAEVMHIGRNFGIGTGLHYTTYADRMHIDAKDLSTTVISDSSYFQANQVTLLYILGNVQINGQEYYVTESRDTVINVLVTTTTSTTTTIRLIDARDIVMQVSYFEIPLLLDAHVIQGSWAIGLRGGPTLGLLSGRKGMVPNSTFDGYEALGEQQFRSTVFGLTARAYIRYRFTNGWSVGLEPTWRGQLGNAMDGGELVRRSSGLGALLSVSYRLR